MKHLLRTLLILALAGPTVLSAQTIANTKHDLSFTGANKVFKAGVLQDQTCVYCHTPHTFLPTGGPMWNRNAVKETPHE